jgi:hypothetical protein
MLLILSLFSEYVISNPHAPGGVKCLDDNQES